MNPDEANAGGPADRDPVRISRRRAIKAGAAGAAAVAVWSAPRIEGLSLAQDTAAAASCSPGTYTGAAGGRGRNNGCWVLPSNVICGQGPLVWNVANSADFTVTGTATGSFLNGNGSTTITVNGIDPPFQPCDVTINGSCLSPGTFTSTPAGVQTLNQDGSVSFNANCGGGTNTSATLTVSVTCACN